MLIEVWKPVFGFEDLYEVSNLGAVKSVRRNALMKKFTNKGYEYAHLCKNGKHFNAKVHRLVAVAFIPNPENKPQVNHKDGNKMNNRANNLEWATALENQRHARETGLNSAGRNNPITSKAVDMLSVDGRFIKTFPSFSEAERSTGIKRRNIQGCCAGRYGCRTAGGFVWKYNENK